MLRWLVRRRSKPKVIIRRFGRSNSRNQDSLNSNGSATIHPTNHLGIQKTQNPIRIATFNVVFFSMAPAVPELTKKCQSFDLLEDDQDNQDDPKVVFNSIVSYVNSRSNLWLMGLKVY
ncbi:hypothetical protein Hanom_Chr02g00156801 [Helianthus anomalus]